MILTLDVGNSQIHGGVFDTDGVLKIQFRKTSQLGLSSDEFGVFLKNVLRENSMQPDLINKIAFCSVVPNLVHSLVGGCEKYFGIRPFILQAGVKTGLKIKYRNPLEVGADRIANAIGATHLFPNKNIIVCDLGTATTFCAISKNKEYLGGLIVPGISLCMEALEERTAKLPAVEIIKPQFFIGRSTVEGIQSGLYHSHLVTIKEITKRIKKDIFENTNTIIVGTGGFSRLFEDDELFDKLAPTLVLHGLYLSIKNNLEVDKSNDFNV